MKVPQPLHLRGRCAGSTASVRAAVRSSQVTDQLGDGTGVSRAMFDIMKYDVRPRHKSHECDCLCIAPELTVGRKSSGLGRLPGE